MKQSMRKAAGLALALAMTAGLLSGCGSSYDPVQEIMGYPSSTVFFTVDGKDVTAGEYFFWMAQAGDDIASYYSTMSENGAINWEDTMGGDQTMDQYVKTSAQQNAVVYSLAANKAKDAGYKYTSQDKSDYQKELTATKEQLGGDEAYQNWLKSMAITDKGFEDLCSVRAVYTHMSDGMCREGGEYAPSQEDLQKYVNDNDLLYAKHILLLTQDTSTGEALPEDQAAAKKAKAEELLAQLQAIQDPEELAKTFDELMKANSEDTGLESNPDGYTFTAGDMVTEFEEATRALEPGQISGLVESTYGYHIIYRMDATTSDEAQEAWAGQKMSQLLNDWVDNAEVVTTEAYDNLTTADFYGKLTAFRDTLKTTEEQVKTETDEVEAETGEPVQEGAEGAVQDTGEAEQAPAE